MSQFRNNEQIDRNDGNRGKSRISPPTQAKSTPILFNAVFKLIIYLFAGASKRNRWNASLSSARRRVAAARLKRPGHHLEPGARMLRAQGPPGAGGRRRTPPIHVSIAVQCQGAPVHPGGLSCTGLRWASLLGEGDPRNTGATCARRGGRAGTCNGAGAERRRSYPFI